MLKKINPFLFLIVISFALGNCQLGKRNQDKENTTDSINTSVGREEAEKSTNLVSQVYYVAVPDTALLGKRYEARVKVNDALLMPLQDPDGKSAGSELSVKLSLTNKSTLADKKFFSVSASDARLEMDTDQAIPPTSTNGKTNPKPDSTSLVEWKFNLPPNAKPSKLHMYLDGTRVTLNLQIK
ncbi:hypothetical protein ACVWYG_001001 [Pedobacter sp. UYEF25]